MRLFVMKQIHIAVSFKEGAVLGLQLKRVLTGVKMVWNSKMAWRKHCHAPTLRAVNERLVLVLFTVLVVKQDCTRVQRQPQLEHCLGGLCNNKRFTNVLYFTKRPFPTPTLIKKIRMLPLSTSCPVKRMLFALTFSQLISVHMLELRSSRRLPAILITARGMGR